MSETDRESAPRKRGNPRAGVGSRGGKGHALTVRITAETRQWLDREVEQTGRSLGQVVEMHLERARQGAEGLEALLGGAQVADAVRALIRHAQLVEKNIGKPSEDVLAKEALQEGWRAIITEAVPYVPQSDAELTIMECGRRLAVACSALRQKLLGLPEGALALSAARLKPVVKGIFAEAQVQPWRRTLLESLETIGEAPESEAARLDLAHGLGAGVVRDEPAIASERSEVLQALEQFNAVWRDYIDRRAQARWEGREYAATAQIRRAAGDEIERKIGPNGKVVDYSRGLAGVIADNT